MQKAWKTSGSSGRHVGDREGIGRGAREGQERSRRGWEGRGRKQKRREGTGRSAMLYLQINNFHVMHAAIDI